MVLELSEEFRFTKVSNSLDRHPATKPEKPRKKHNGMVVYSDFEQYACMHGRTRAACVQPRTIRLSQGRYCQGGWGGGVSIQRGAPRCACTHSCADASVANLLYGRVCWEQTHITKFRLCNHSPPASDSIRICLAFTCMSSLLLIIF